MKEATLKRLIDEYVAANGADGLSGQVLELLSLENRIRVQIGTAHRHAAEEETRHETLAADIQEDIAAARLRCPHYERTYHGDQLDGTVRGTECDLCGKLLD